MFLKNFSNIFPKILIIFLNYPNISLSRLYTYRFSTIAMFMHYFVLYTYRFSTFTMFMHYFVNYFVRLQTNHYTLLTISSISFIFDSARKLMRNLTNARTSSMKNLWSFELIRTYLKIL